MNAWQCVAVPFRSILVIKGTAMSFDLATHVSSREHENLSGRIRPSGRFSFCQVFRKKKRRLEDGKVQHREKIALLMLRYDSLHGGTSDTWRINYLCRLLSGNRYAPKAIGSSIAVNSESRAKRGSRGITSRQRDALCWGANAIEHVYGKQNLSFLTLTLPDLSERDFDAVRENWSEIVHYVTRLIHARLNDKNIRTTICGCTELQLERFEKCQRFYPHLHLVFRGRKGNRHDWAIKPSSFRTFWIRSVRRFLHDPISSWHASENVQRVKKSVGGYLAKYISKCASKHVDTALDRWHPSDWILLSRKLRSLYETLSHSGYECGKALQQIASRWTVGDGYKKSIYIRSESYGERKIGEWGWLKGWLVFPEYSDVHPITFVTSP